ncbi:hypothetical protein LX36DRAFT_684890 [Colletotrichum falcatum]|nr:hypothetical protein LX36DRAFT_684890 [Colletotrichum falcatum]
MPPRRSSDLREEEHTVLPALHAALLSTSPHRKREYLDPRARVPHARHPWHGSLRPDEHRAEPPRLGHGAPHQGHQGHQEHANALVATLHMAFIRGILIIGTQMWIKGIRPIFVNLLGEDSSVWADGAVESIAGLRGLCRDVVKMKCFDLIMAMANKLHTSSWEGKSLRTFGDAGAYQILTRHYCWRIQLPHVIDMGNQTMVLLASHWIALKQIMAFTTNAEHECREKAPLNESVIDPGIARGLGHLNRQVDDEHLAYSWWPLWVEGRLEQDLGFFGKRC